MATCTICKHKKRLEIDKECLLSDNISATARKFKVSSDALSRHYHNHLIPEIEKAHAESSQKLAIVQGQEAEAAQVLKSVQEMALEVYELAISSARAAKEKGSYNAIGSCMGPAVKVLEIVSNVSNPSTPANNGTWEETRLAIIRAVDNAPEAKEAIIAALEQFRGSVIRPGPGNMGEGSIRLPSRSLAEGPAEVQSEEDTGKLF